MNEQTIFICISAVQTKLISVMEVLSAIKIGPVQLAPLHREFYFPESLVFLSKPPDKKWAIAKALYFSVYNRDDFVGHYIDVM